jgi:hypothetical protein
MVYHYGWVRSEAQMNLKSASVHKYWDSEPAPKVDYSQIDATVLKFFPGTHPKVIQDWLPKAEGIFMADPDYKLTSREKKHRWMLKLEKMSGGRFNKKHYRLIG